MLSFASAKKGEGSEAEKLKAENMKLKGEISELSKSQVSAAAEEEEEEEDDELDEEPEEFKNPPPQSSKMRTSVSAEAYGAWNQKKAFTPPVYAKGEDQAKRLSDILKKSFLFSSLEAKDLTTV